LVNFCIQSKIIRVGDFVKLGFLSVLEWGRLYNIPKGAQPVETYFIATRVTPLTDNPLAARVEEARVYFWIVEPASQPALERALRYIEAYKWKLEAVEKEPVVVTAADFVDQEDGLKNWWKAKQNGFAAHFVAKPRSQPQEEP
jgi:hypothetical protein